MQPGSENPTRRVPVRGLRRARPAVKIRARLGRQRGKQPRSPRQCQFSGRYDPQPWKKQLTLLRSSGPCRYNTPGKNDVARHRLLGAIEGVVGSVQRPHILPRANARHLSIARRRGRIWGLRSPLEVPMCRGASSRDDSVLPHLGRLVCLRRARRHLEDADVLL